MICLKKKITKSCYLLVNLTLSEWTIKAIHKSFIRNSTNTISCSNKKIEKSNHIKAQWKTYKLKSEPFKHNMSQSLKNIKNLPKTWMKSPKLTKTKYNNFHNNLNSKKTPIKNKSSHLIKKTLKILKIKKETLICRSFN